VLAHYIEEEGVPTACISIVRPYTEKVKPPRSLWVSFELGRPLGVPNDPAFQKRVLVALLKLLEAPEDKGPILIEDYPEDVPEVEGGVTVLSCPIDYGQIQDKPEGADQLETSFLREITAMRPWYDMAMAKRKRTTVGVSGIDLDSIGGFIYAFIKGETPENPRQDVDLATTLKTAVEDLRAYYFEGVTTQPGQENASNEALLNWFWYETVAGKVILELNKACKNSPNKSLNMLAERFPVPHSWTYTVQEKGK
jgi:hypothetical protein